MSAVIVRLPGGLSSDGVEIAVPVDNFDREDAGVLVRPANSSQMWMPLADVGGSVEVR